MVWIISSRLFPSSQGKAADISDLNLKVRNIPTFLHLLDPISDQLLLQMCVSPCRACAQTAPQVHLELQGSPESLEIKALRDLLGNLDKMVSRWDTSPCLWSVAVVL